MAIPPENGQTAPYLSHVNAFFENALSGTPGGESDGGEGEGGRGVPAADGNAAAAGDPATRRLAEFPGLFDWRQAVRIAEDAARRSARRAPAFGYPPDEESPRLRASAEMSHSFSDVADYAALPDGRAELTLSLTDAASRLTLLGAHGAMPAVYSELALDRADRGDTVFLEFLAMFEHRLLSLAYRGWWHQRLELRREQSGAGEDLPDMDEWLDAMAGLALTGADTRLRGTSRWPVRRFAPLFANAARTAWGLAALLGAYAGVPVRVEELAPRWLELPLPDQNRLPDRAHPDGVNARLGGGLVLGEHVREAQSNFNLVLGPMRWEVFQEFLPDAPEDRLGGLCELARLYAGADRSFGVRMELGEGEARGIFLGGSGARLGWSVWLLSEGGGAGKADVFFDEEKI